MVVFVSAIKYIVDFWDQIILGDVGNVSNVGFLAASLPNTLVLFSPQL